jgi:phosphoserine aminotransferase
MTTTTLAKRIHNFGAGPAALPLPVLERVQAELLDYAGTGMSVLEMSHRSAAFEGIIQKAEEDLRALAGLGSDHVVLFLQGGASLQFSMLPANLRAASASADYVVTGHWAKAAVKEAEKSGRARVAGTTEATSFDRVPAAGELQLDPQAAYLHFTSNNTIYGTQWATASRAAEGRPARVRHVFRRSQPAARHRAVRARLRRCAEEPRPAGVTLVVMRRELLERVPAGLPAVLDYKLMAENRSLYNTPPCFAIYVTGLVLAWLREQGGLAAAGERNAAKAALVYEAIDGSDGFYRGHAQPGSRSAMNVTFRLKDAAAEKAFLADAQAEGLDGLKGHRSVGGVRASLYNACPMESAAALASFMGEFRRRRG